MATKAKAAVLDDTLVAEEVEETTAEQSEKQVINEGISRVIESIGVEGQHHRYKAMRAIAFQAFSNAIADGSFDELVDEAIANVDSLPSGWEVERTPKEEAAAKPAPKAKAAAGKAPAKAPAKKAAAKPAAKPAAGARRRPTR